MNFVKKFFFLAIFLYASNFYCVSISGAQQVATEDKFKVIRLSHNLERQEGLEEIPIVTAIDKHISGEMLDWHKATTQELKILDPQVNPAGAKGYRNLCSLRISVVYRDGENLIKRDATFRDEVFLSGSDLSAMKPEGFNVGQLRLRNNPYTVRLEPGVSNENLPDMTSAVAETFHAALPKSGQANKLPLKLEKRFVSLEEFFTGKPLEYEKHVIEYFKFSSILDSAQKEEVKKAFVRFFTPALQNNPFLKVDNILDGSKIALDDAFLVLPFNPASNEKSIKYFNQTADALFKEFKHNFCDSEQAIRLFIDFKARALGRILGFRETGVPLNVKQLVQIYVNIGSIRYMCPICQGTYLYDINEARIIQRSIVRGILSAQGQDPRQADLLVVEPCVVIYVSGIKPTAKEK